MTLQEFYAGIDGNYDEALKRLMSEKFMLRFLGKFADGGDFSAMMEAIRAENWEDVFRHSHNLKGVCLNLELGRLARTASAICDTVRGGAPTVDLTPMARQAEEDYALVMAGIRELQAAQG
jgi:HPt (histidine-containing phosphotransfer) domain-containing protein